MQIYTVGQVARYLKDLLTNDPALVDLWLTGELSNVSQSPAGHVFFTLKDRDCQLKCVMFRRPGRFFPAANGDAVVTHGHIALYEAGGTLQFYADLIQPEGVGLLHLQFEQLRAKLEAEGLFEAARKRRLPLFPKRIGVVTSPTGAVIRDIQNVVGRRYPLAELVIAPTPVQGDDAVAGIESAIEALVQLGNIDVIIVARGGGSVEDLQAFNDERVARAIFGCPIPVVSGVGHETDYTIVDYVADLRAPTPSAAAELAVPDSMDLKYQVEARQRHIVAAMSDLLIRRQNAMKAALATLRRFAPDLANQRLRVDDLVRRMAAKVDNNLMMEKERVNSRVLQLTSLSPLLTLSRGYAVVRRKDQGGIVRSVEEVKRGDNLEVRVSDGSFEVSVR
ncbi:MAG: exodeoxyribonuclease VII large subunit [Dehalococcoidia bacterium]|nr:exodeoxyribonuclease VII large subunit [Dehalococcoidia bacterium]